MEKTKQILRFFLGIPIGILSFVFMAKILFDSRFAVISAIEKINLPIFLLGVIFFSIFFMIKSLIWINILKKRGFGLTSQNALLTYSLSETKRYIPGNIFAFISRIDSLSSKIPKKETIKSIAIEAVLLAISALIVSIPALLYPVVKTGEVTKTPVSLPLFLIFIGITLGILLLTKKFLSIVKKHYNHLLLFVLAWIFYAVGALLVSVSLSYIYPNNIFYIASFYVLAWLVGYISFITPMGLGVRELFITGSLSVFFPLTVASLLAVMTRISMILGEFFFIIMAFSFSKLKKKSIIFKLDPYFVTVFFSAVLYAIYFINYTFLRYKVYISGRFDLGNMSQTVWNTSHGKFLILTNPDGTEPISRLAIHTDVLLAFIAPLYYIWSDPRMLLIIQTLVLSIGSIFIYLIAKNIINNKKISLIIAISFLLNFWVQEQNIFDFHAVTMATTFLLVAFYFLIKKRWFGMLIFLLLSALTKENVFLVISFFGLYIFFKEKKYLYGSILTIIPIIIFYYLITNLIPHARGNTHFALSYYSYIGDSTQGILKNLLLKPQLVISRLISLSTLDYLQQLFLPIGFLSFVSPLFVLFAVPDMAINLLSTNENLRSHQFHYGAIIIPFVYISSIYAIKKIISKYKKPFAADLVFFYLLFFSVLSLYLYSPLPGMRTADYTPFYEFNSKTINSYLSLIPQNASVAASNNIGAHLSHRDKIYVIPNGTKTADYIVLYNEMPSALNLVDSRNYNLLIQDGNFFLFKKK